MASDKAVDGDQQTQWLAQWKAAAAALHEQRATELGEMTPAEAWVATESGAECSFVGAAFGGATNAFRPR